MLDYASSAVICKGIGEMACVRRVCATTVLASGLSVRSSRRGPSRAALEPPQYTDRILRDGCHVHRAVSYDLALRYGAGPK